MTVTDVRKDAENLSMVFTAEFDHPIDAVWQLWADPRKLERWWGPPTYPATMVEFNFVPDGNVHYFMTSPEGDKYHGWWKFIKIDYPSRIEFEDGFSHDDGSPNPAMPQMKGFVTFSEKPNSSTVMLIEVRFASAEDMEQISTMGMEEGMKGALSQTDAILAE